MKQKRQQIGILGIIKYNEKILMVKRSPYSKYEPNMWGFIGEAVEFGEDPTQTLKRGIKDETGLDIASYRLLDVFSRYFETTEEQKHVILISYICKPTNDKIKLNKELVEYGWFNLDETPELDVIEGDRKVINRLRKHIAEYN